MNTRQYRLGLAAIVVPAAAGIGGIAAAIVMSTGSHSATPQRVHIEQVAVVQQIAPAPKASVKPAPEAVRRRPSRVIYIEDHTSKRWPVREAARSWSQGTDLNLIYGPCRAGAGCIKVQEGFYGPHDGWAAWISDGVITFNDSYPQDARSRRQAACHEEGHALGLKHSPTDDSCMYYKETAHASPYPNARDRAAVSAKY